MPRVNFDPQAHPQLVWVKRAQAPAGFPQICDLAATPSGLIVAASKEILGEDGARLFRLTADSQPAALHEILRWDGQGFLRVHAYDDLLVVPDSDAPFHLLPFMFSLKVDGFLFVSDDHGQLGTHSREVLRDVYHVFDSARLADGRLVATAGAYNQGGIAYIGRHESAPAALFLDDGPGRPWRRIHEFPSATAPGVNRFTFMHATPDGALLIATQHWGSRAPQPWALRVEDVTGTPRWNPISGLGGAVLRWAQFGDAIYAVVQGNLTSELRVSRDGGRSFLRVQQELLAAQAIVPTQQGLFLLSDGELLHSADGAQFTRVAPGVAALLHRRDYTLSAPLVAYNGTLWAGSTRSGEIFAAVPADSTPGKR